MTHPSHHLNFGMNPDHARNSLSNCGIRQPKYGDRKVHHMHMRKKGMLLHHHYFSLISRLISKKTFCPLLICWPLFFWEISSVEDFNGYLQTLVRSFWKTGLCKLRQQVKSWEKARIINGRMYFLWILASIIFLICCSTWWANWRIFC